MSAPLYERVLEARLRHLLLLERRMMALLARVQAGDQDARHLYEWYLGASKTMTVKDLVSLGKYMVPEEEVSIGFEGFDED